MCWGFIWLTGWFICRCQTGSYRDGWTPRRLLLSGRQGPGNRFTRAMWATAISPSKLWPASYRLSASNLQRALVTALRHREDRCQNRLNHPEIFLMAEQSSLRAHGATKNTSNYWHYQEPYGRTSSWNGAMYAEIERPVGSRHSTSVVTGLCNRGQLRVAQCNTSWKAATLVHVRARWVITAAPAKRAAADVTPRVSTCRRCLKHVRRCVAPTWVAVAAAS